MDPSYWYALWYKGLNSDMFGNMSNIPIPVNNKPIIYVDVPGLMPNTAYIFAMRVHDLEDALFSDNIATTVTTKGS